MEGGLLRIHGPILCPSRPLSNSGTQCHDIHRTRGNVNCYQWLLDNLNRSTQNSLQVFFPMLMKMCWSHSISDRSLTYVLNFVLLISFLWQLYRDSDSYKNIFPENQEGAHSPTLSVMMVSLCHQPLFILSLSLLTLSLGLCLLPQFLDTNLSLSL